MTKTEIIKKLRPFLEINQDIVAAWEGGSNATGNEDMYSDLDLMIVTQNESKEKVYHLMVDYLQSEFGVERQYRVKEPTWHGFSQGFFKLKNTPEYFYIDMAVMTKDTDDKFISEQRHGKANIWFDKENVLDTKPLASDVIKQKVDTMTKRATDIDFLFIIETKKQIYRQNFTEAFTAMYRFLQSSASVMFNLEHRPYQVDFGLRYAYRAYSTHDFSIIERCLKADSISSLDSAFSALLKRYELLKDKHAPKG